jgi:hypothetical protein
MSESTSPGRRHALELGRQHGTLREERAVTAPDGKPGVMGAADLAKTEKPSFEGVKPAREPSLPFKRA